MWYKPFYPTLTNHEQEDTLQYISTVSGTATKGNMKKLAEHSYAIGKIQPLMPNSEEREALSLRPQDSTNVLAYYRAFHKNILYHSTDYSKGLGKRDSTVCAYTDHHNHLQYGQIQKFVFTSSTPYVLLRRFSQSSRSLLQRAGNSCRNCLQIHEDADILSKYVVAVEHQMSNVITTELNSLVGKCMLVSVSEGDCNCVVPFPNNYERH